MRVGELEPSRVHVVYEPKMGSGLIPPELPSCVIAYNATIKSTNSNRIDPSASLRRADDEVLQY